MNYDIEMKKIIENLDYKPKLLLHSCCAPCSTTVIETLKEHFDITIIYYNPNIEPFEEYEKRKNDSDYRFRKKLEDKGVTASIKQSVKGTGVDPALGQKVRAKGYEKDD